MSEISGLLCAWHLGSKHRQDVPAVTLVGGDALCRDCAMLAVDVPDVTEALRGRLGQDLRGSS